MRCEHPACDNQATKQFTWEEERRSYCAWHHNWATEIIRDLTESPETARLSAYSFGDKVTCRGRKAIYVSGGPDDFWTAVLYADHIPGENPEHISYAKYRSIQPGWSTK